MSEQKQNKLIQRFKELVKELDLPDDYTGPVKLGFNFVTGYVSGRVEVTVAK